MDSKCDVQFQESQGALHAPSSTKLSKRPFYGGVGRSGAPWETVGNLLPRGTQRSPTSLNRLAWNGVSESLFFHSLVSRGRKGSEHEAIWREAGRAGNTKPGGEGKETRRESERRGVTERLSSAEGSAGHLGNKERALGAEAPAGN